tara:strand:- start:653 stop:913 length:261 start_codon:yes stop_codon:yes gene_type:complete
LRTNVTGEEGCAPVSRDSDQDGRSINQRRKIEAREFRFVWNVDADIAQLCGRRDLTVYIVPVGIGEYNADVLKVIGRYSLRASITA